MVVVVGEGGGEGGSVAMEASILIQCAPKPHAVFPYPNDGIHTILIKICRLALEIFKFKSEKFLSLKGE